MALNNMGLGLTFKATDEASPVMKGVSNNLTKTADAGKAASLSLKDTGRAFEKVGAVSTVAGASIAAGLGLAVSEAAKFQFGVAQVATEADKAKLPAAKIAELAKQMATTYGGDLDTQIKAAYQGVAAGADDAAKSLALLNGANRLAIAGATTQETALLGITKVLNNYHMSFDKATDVADAFFVAVKGGQTTVGELGDAIGQVAALSKNAGLSMEEMIGALGTAATLGKDTASSAAAMKAALSGIAHPTAEAAAEAAKLGIKFDSVNLRSKGLVGFLKEITGSSKYSADSMNKLFGSVEASGFMAALGANKMAALNDMMAGMSKKSGGAEEAFQTMSATLKQVASVLTANVQVALVDIGTAFLPAITAAAKFTTGIVKGFNDMPAPVKKGVAMLLALSAAVLLAGGALGTIVGVLLTSEIPAIAFAVAIGSMVSVMAPLVVMGGLVAATVLAVKRAFDENVGGLRDTVLPTVKKIELAWNALSQAFSQGGFSGAVRTELDKAANQGIKNFAINVYTWFSRIGNFFEGLKKGFVSASDAAAPTFARLSLAIDKLGAAFTNLFGGKQDPAKAAQTFDKFGEAGSRVGSTIEKVAEVVVSGFTYAMEFAASFMNFMGRLEPTFSKVWEGAKQLWSAFGDLGSAFGDLAGAFSVGGASADTTAGTFGVLIGVLVTVFSWTVKIAAFLIGGMAAAFKVLAFVVGGVKDVIVFMFHSIIDNMIATVTYAAKAVDAVGGLVGKKVGAEAGLKDFGKSLSGGGATAAATALPGASANGPAAAAPVALPSAAAAQGNWPALADIKGANNAAGGKGGASADAIGASVATAMKAAPPPQVTVNAPILLDGEKIGEAMAAKGGAANGRSFTPGPAPAG